MPCRQRRQVSVVYDRLNVEHTGEACVVDEQVLTFGQRVGELATLHPDKAALIFLPIEGEERTLNWRTLDCQSNQFARLLATYGVGPGTTIVVGLWNSPEHVLLTTAAWKLGALMLPLRAILPKPERDGILELANPILVCADWDDVGYPLLRPGEMARIAEFSDEPLPDDPPHPGKAIASGGSTGRSKIIVDQTANPTVYGRRASRLGARPGQVQLICAPLYHNSPFLSSYGGLADDHTLVIMEKFDAARAVEAIERHRVNYAYMPPIIMRRIIVLPGVRDRDFSSIQAIQSSAAPCPIWLKQAWIDLIGAEKVHEVYGSSEGIGATMIRGDEWLDHQGSVGLAVNCELKILDEHGEERPSGEVGEIFMRTLSEDGPTFGYIGDAKLTATPDGFLSIGDLGYVDDDGYLYIADRRTDMIVSGGANVYPAEVEAALHDHPAIGDLAVIGVADDDWGRRVHAVIEPTDPLNPPTATDLDAYVRERLTSYKVPKTYEFVTSLPRNEAGKIRRSSLVDERASGWTDGMIRARE